jgi:hypothetical protein
MSSPETVSFTFVDGVRYYGLLLLIVVGPQVLLLTGWLAVGVPGAH